MLTVKYTPLNIVYAENSQVNPIRFCILKEKDGVFVNLTNWFKCRDFFNDVVYTKQTGNPITIYGFNSELGLSKDEDMFLALGNLTIPTFKDNWALVNSYLEKQKLPIVPLFDNNVVKIPSFYTKNTFNISLLTALMRFSNYKPLNKLEDILTVTENYLESCILNAIKFPLFKLPKDKQEYIFYVNQSTNDKQKVSRTYLPSYVHNNGIISWNAAT